MLPVTERRQQPHPADPLARRRRPPSKAVAVYRSTVGDVAFEARFFAESDGTPILGELLLIADRGVSISATTLRGIAVAQILAAAVLGEDVENPDLRITRPDGTVDWYEEFATTFLRA